MTGRYALVDGDGLVENIVVWDGTAPWSPPAGLSAAQAGDEVAIGWTLIEGVWSAPIAEDL